MRSCVSFASNWENGATLNVGGADAPREHLTTVSEPQIALGVPHAEDSGESLKPGLDVNAQDAGARASGSGKSAANAIGRARVKRRKRCKGCARLGRWLNAECSMCRTQLYRKPSGRGNAGMGKPRHDITPEMVAAGLAAGESQASMARRWNVCQDTIIRRKRQICQPSLHFTSVEPSFQDSGQSGVCR